MYNFIWLCLFAPIISFGQLDSVSYPTKGPQYWFESHFQVIKTAEKVQIHHQDIVIVADYCMIEIRWPTKLRHIFKYNLDWIPVLDAGVKNAWAYHDDEYLIIMELTSEWVYIQSFEFPYTEHYYYFEIPETFTLNLK